MTPFSGNARVVVLASLLSVACGGGLSQEDYSEAYGVALCHRKARCGQIRDEAACARHARAFSHAVKVAEVPAYFQFEESMRAGRLRFDEEAAQDCVAHIRDGACDDSLAAARNGDGCEVLEGRQKDGKPCVLTEECGKASYCDGLTEAACVAGTCRPRVGLGQPVTGAQECAPGLVAVRGTCQAPAEEGGACATDSRCASGLYCDVGGTGVCRRFGGEGAVCHETGARCLSYLHCREGSCQRLLDVGADCTPGAGGPGLFTGGCKEDLACEGASQGICRERPGLGEPCPDDVCQTYLFCDSLSLGGTGTCQTFRQAGESCASMLCAPGTHCNGDSMTCERQGRLGEPCPSSSPWSCISGLQCRNVKCQPAFGGFCGELSK